MVRSHCSTVRLLLPLLLIVLVAGSPTHSRAADLSPMANPVVVEQQRASNAPGGSEEAPAPQLSQMAVTPQVTCAGWLGPQRLNAFDVADGNGGCVTAIKNIALCNNPNPNLCDVPFSSLDLSGSVLMEGFVQIPSGTSVTIEPGTIIHGQHSQLYGQGGPLSSVGFRVEGGGTLNINGTFAAQVLMTSLKSTPQPGDINGIAFWPGSSGTISYLHLSYGGNGLQDSHSTTTGATLLIDGASPAIRNSTIDYTTNYANSSGAVLKNAGAPTLDHDSFANIATGRYAVQVYGGSRPVLSNDSFTSSTGFANLGVIFDSNDIDRLTNASFSDPVHSMGIHFQATGISGAVLTLTETGAPYILETSSQNPPGNFDVQSGLTLSAGATLQMQGALTVKSGGILRANGVTGAMASFTTSSSAPSPGGWGGIDFQQGSAGNLTFAHIAYGGAFGRPCVSIEGAATSPTITGWTIDDCGGDGVDVIAGATPTLDRDSFLNIANFQYAVAVRGGAMPVLSNDTFSSANGFNNAGVLFDSNRVDLLTNASFTDPRHSMGIHFLGGSLTANLALTDPGAPYVPDGNPSANARGDIIVPNGITLTLAADTTLEMVANQTYGGLYILAGGRLNANGAAGHPARITSTLDNGTLNPDGTVSAPAAGDWAGVGFEGSSNGHLSFAHISYGGAWPACAVPATFGCGKLAEILVDGARPTISNSIIDHSYGNGVELFNAAGPFLSADRFETISGAPYYALAADDLDSGATLQNDVFTSAAGFANRGLRLAPEGVGQLTGATFHDPVNSMAIHVLGGMVTLTATWNNFQDAHRTPPAIPYVLADDIGAPPAAPDLTIASGANLTIASGNTVQMVGNIFVSSGGTFNVRGVAGSLVSFTSNQATPHPGDYGGIAYQHGSAGAISYTQISYGGKWPACGNSFGCGKTGELLIEGPDVSLFAVTVGFSRLDHPLGNGIDVFGDAAPLITDSSFDMIASGSYAISVDDLVSVPDLTRDTFRSESGFANKGIRLAPNGGNFLTNLHFYDDAFSEAIHVIGGTVTEQSQWNSQIWESSNPAIYGHASYVVGDDLSVAGSVADLVLGPDNSGGDVRLFVQVADDPKIGGNTLKLAGSLYVTSLGWLTVNGAIGRPVRISSAKADARPGDWGAIDFEERSAGSLTYAYLSNGGGVIHDSRSAPHSTEVLIEGADHQPAIDIENSIFEQSAGNQLEVMNGYLPVLSDNSFEVTAVPGSSRSSATRTAVGPGQAAVSAPAANPAFYGIANDGWVAGQPALDAQNNWWGSSDGPSGAGSGQGTGVSAGVNFTPFLTCDPSSSSCVVPSRRMGDVNGDGVVNAVDALCLL
ncbi:MAG: hypothetical protein ACR2PL_07870, partial [Dehalococcoidia bacterium]